MTGDIYYPKSIDIRDSTTDNPNFFMTREVYCGFPVYGPQGDVVDLERGFAVTFDDKDYDHKNYIWEIYPYYDNFLDNPNMYDDMAYLDNENLFETGDPLEESFDIFNDDYLKTLT